MRSSANGSSPWCGRSAGVPGPESLTAENTGMFPLFQRLTIARVAPGAVGFVDSYVFKQQLGVARADERSRGPILRDLEQDPP
jgi:hypothetical protein